MSKQTQDTVIGCGFILLVTMLVSVVILVMYKGVTAPDLSFGIWITVGITLAGVVAFLWKTRNR